MIPITHVLGFKQGSAANNVGVRFGIHSMPLKSAAYNCMLQWRKHQRERQVAVVLKELQNVRGLVLVRKKEKKRKG